MIFELSREFFFDSAHTLERKVDAEPSRRVHGHTYHARVTVRGEPDATTGMVVDLGDFMRVLHGVRSKLDHRMLNEVPGLEAPTLEALCSFVFKEVSPSMPGVCRVSISRRASGEKCTLSV